MASLKRCRFQNFVDNLPRIRDWIFCLSIQLDLSESGRMSSWYQLGFVLGFSRKINISDKRNCPLGGRPAWRLVSLIWVGFWQLKSTSLQQKSTPFWKEHAISRLKSATLWPLNDVGQTRTQLQTGHMNDWNIAVYDAVSDIRTYQCVKDCGN